MKDYFNKTLWIIGASSGIGRALAVELGARGATLVLSSRDNTSLSELETSLPGLTFIVPLDVCDGAAVENAYRDISERFTLDSVIYMAGTYHPGAIEDMDLRQAKMIVETNFIGALNVVHAVLPAFLARKSGQIALCASVAGYRGLPQAQPYGATKAALINFAESLRAETLSRGIDIKVINPGFVRTPMTAKNSFPMPMMIEANIAAQCIANELKKNTFEIRFPKLFTFLMKVLRVLPSSLYFFFVKK
jgi:short-subunit dehydrogenase